MLWTLCDRCSIGSMERKAYPSGVTDDEWAVVVPYLTLMTEDAPRIHSLRDVFNGQTSHIPVGWSCTCCMRIMITGLLVDTPGPRYPTIALLVCSLPRLWL